MEKSARQELIEYLASRGVDDAESFVKSLSDEDCAIAMGGFRQDEAEKAALRSRLMSDPILRQVICPDASFASADVRYEISKTALAILERTAEAHSLTVESLVAAFHENGDSMARTIEMFGDPRFDRCDKQTYYAFRCRVRDAVQTAQAEEAKAARERARQERYAKIEAMGLEVCARCDGHGGFSYWPDFTCYGCGGVGGVDKE
jgi:hypothetical protein